jgi:DNA-binding response OmpR family regulator
MEPRTDQESGRRWILVVDSDAQIQRLLDLSLRNAGFHVKVAATATEALASLEKAPPGLPDLILAETKFSDGPDGFEFCRQIKKRPDGAMIAFIFLAEQSVEAKLRCVEAGADDFLAKPLYVQEVVARARALLQRRERDRLEVLARGDARFVGQLDDLPLLDLLRALEANRKSGVVHLQALDGARGEIYFRDGSVVDAEVGRLSGLDAVCRLFSWAEGRFEIEWKSIRRKDAVATEPGALLMEALRRLDEWRRLLEDVPSLSTIFEVDYRLLAERLAEIPDEVNGILRLFDGQRTFIHVIDDCGLGDLEALAVIGKLHREQIIRDVREKPDAPAALGADMEGWLTEAAGPFRAAPAHLRRDLFGAPPEAGAGVHGRPTKPIEPLEEGGPELAVEERRERFTDRLIAEGAAPANSPASVPASAAAPPTRPPIWAAETTQQGLGLPVPALSTRPGFAAVALPPAPPARLARAVLTDVTPSVRAEAASVVPGSGDGVPQPILPQSPEPAILIPLAAEAISAAPLMSVPVDDQRPVAGEILARAHTAKVIDARTTAGQEAAGKRVTDLGIGPAASLPAAGRLSEAVDGSGPMSATTASGFGTTRPEDSRPVRKIILDPEVPEEDDDQQGGSSRRRNGLLIGLGLALAFGVGWAALKNSGRSARRDRATAATERNATAGGVTVPGAANKAVTGPASTSMSTSVGAGAPGRDKAETAAAAPVVAARATGAPASHGAGARHAAASPREAPREVMDERAADPKVARALPTEFPQLLAACRTAFTEKRSKDAETACVAAKDANPDSAEACALLGHALFNRNHRREALQWAERSVKLDPNHADAYVIIGGVKQANDDNRAAKAAYQKYLELAPNGQYAADMRAILDAL